MYFVRKNQSVLIFLISKIRNAFVNFICGKNNIVLFKCSNVCIKKNLPKRHLLNRKEIVFYSKNKEKKLKCASCNWKNHGFQHNMKKNPKISDPPILLKLGFC